MVNNINSSEINPLIIQRFGLENLVSKSGKDEYVYKCPFCTDRGKSPDLKGKLYVNNKSLKYHCFRCGKSGRLIVNSSTVNLIPTPSNSELISKLEEQVNISAGISLPEDRIVKLEYEIPRFYPLPGSQEYNYLKSRGISDYLIKRYDIRIGSIVSKYAYRVIIPNRVIQKDENSDLTDMFVARYIFDIPKNEEGRYLVQRYLNPFGANRRKVVFNLHRIKENQPIIITEGCFTAISAGLNAVATYGKLVTNDQINQILAKKPSRLYINLDPDAYYSDTLKLCSRINKRLPELPLYIVRFNKEEGEHVDASDMTKEKYLYYLKRARLYNPFELKIMSSLGLDHAYLDVFKEN